jgi:rSAM/selenodomain-associated transferase 1
MNYLIIFIKNPILGKVKTRLAATVGAKTALQIYKILCRLTQNVALQTAAHRYVFYSDFIDKTDDWAAPFFIKKLQKNIPDLGERMAAAFELIFKINKTLPNKILIIGSDCPDITSRLLTTAYESLDKNDIVIGPAQDGGYYLLGMKTLHHELFSDMEWSVNTVLNQTIERAQKSNLSIHLLPILNDIDTEEDYLKWQGHNVF